MPFYVRSYKGAHGNQGQFLTFYILQDILNQGGGYSLAFQFLGNLCMGKINFIFCPYIFNFGNNASEFANDGECDDRRFTGEGMTSTELLDSDVSHDATDCRKAYYAGTITLR